MRRPIALLAAALLAGAALAACGGAAAPSRTAAATAPAVTTPPPVTAAPPTPVGGESIGPGAMIAAQNLQFDPTAVTVAADEPFAIVFDNRDAGIPHDIQVSDANGNVIVKSEIVNGPTRLVVQVPALGAGTYPFVCVVHPNMTGTITAE